MVIHELEGAIEYYFSRCGGETKEHFDAYVKGRVEHHNLIVTKNSPLGPMLKYGSRLLFERGLLPDFKSTWNRTNMNCTSLSERPSFGMAMQIGHVAYLFFTYF